MNIQNLLIYKFQSLYHIFEEVCVDLGYNVSFFESEKSLNDKANIIKNYIVISNIKNLNMQNAIYIDNLPINIFKLIEIINIQFLKIRFNNQTRISIKDFFIDLNSKEISLNNIKLKLTEKEVNTILYLSNSKKPVSISELQQKVWGYRSDSETHTVETHIYRLRKKILKIFEKDEFIISKKNGYKIN